MNDGRQRIHPVAIQHNIELYHVGLPESDQVIIKGSVPAGYRLQFIEEVEDNLRQGHFETQFHPVGRQVMLIFQNATLIHTQTHDRTDVLRLGNDLRHYERLFNMVHACWVRHFRRRVDELNRPVRHDRTELHGRYGRNHGHAEFAFQSFLHDLHVEHAEEAAAESKSQRCGCLGFPHQRCVVELKLLHGSSQFFKLRRIDRIYPRKHHGLHVLETLDRFTRAIDVRDGIPHFHFARDLDAGDQVIDVACAYLLHRLLLYLETADLVCVVYALGRDEFDDVACAYRTVKDSEVDLHTPEGIIHRIEDHRLKRRVGITFRGRDAVDNSVEDFADADTFFGAGGDDVLALATDQI